MYQFKSLKDISNREITNCLNLAFSDYAVPFQLTEDQLQVRLAASGADKELSYGAFLDNEMVGCIINSCSIYNNKKVVFDVATGIIPEHQGKNVFNKLFKFTEHELLKHGVEKYHLEVLLQNNAAIQAYIKQGFRIAREFHILKSPNSVIDPIDLKLDYINIEDFDFSKTNHCKYLNPSYEHSTNILKMSPHLYDVAYKQKDHTITAFCIYSKDNGHILQMGYTNISELKEIIHSLMSKFSNIIAKNIDKVYLQELETLYSIGFIEVAKQYEMSKDLSKA